MNPLADLTDQRVGGAVDDLVRDLETVLGTREGDMPSDPEFGVGDVSLIYQSGEGAAQSWCLKTQETLRRYVRRFHNIRVTHKSGRPLDLTFRVKIQGTLVVDGHRASVEFEASHASRRSWRID